METGTQTSIVKGSKTPEKMGVLPNKKALRAVMESALRAEQVKGRVAALTTR